MNAALVPHVLMPMDNDLTLLQDLYEQIGSKERVCLINKNLNAAEYKYVISKCRFGVFARTHACIAAYSSGVPALAIGYSSKSKGVAADLGLGKFVLPLDDFQDDFSLLKKFENLMTDENEIKRLLSDRIPSCKEKAAVDPLQYVNRH
jgi:polysaccharide pyruvyl transferase WcaK-like protein